MDSSYIKETLLKAGYANIKDFGKEYRMRPLYRESSNDSVLCVYKDSGNFIDFSRKISGSFAELIRLSLGLSSITEAKKWLGEGSPQRTPKNESTINLTQTSFFDDSNLQLLKNDHSYWEKRGIGKDTIKIFKGGLDEGVERGKFQHRYIFPILNSQQAIIGFSGRYTKPLLPNSPIPKWKHLGRKSTWVYPAFFNKEILIKYKEIILVESIGDMLSLWGGGIKNSLVIFGLDISEAILCFLLRVNAKKITIALNNDASNNNAGNKAAYKLQQELFNYFDSPQIKIAFPYKNDFGDMTKDEIKLWGKEHA